MLIVTCEFLTKSYIKESDKLVCLGLNIITEGDLKINVR